MSEENRTTARRLVEEIWNKGDLSVADELIAANYTHHDPSTPDLGRGPEGEKKRVAIYRGAFPDLRFTIEDSLVEEDTVVLRWSAQGTHRGELNGIAPTGKKTTVTGITISRFAGHKLVEGWVYWDALGLLQQLGAIPAPAKAQGAGQ
jgi:steroid delta-isomerase-like uncharacterized protein